MMNINRQYGLFGRRQEGVMVKIKEYKIQKQGLRGLALTIPKIWIDDNFLRPGDVVEFFRDEENHLILVAKKAEDSQ